MAGSLLPYTGGKPPHRLPPPPALFGGQAPPPIPAPFSVTKKSWLKSALGTRSLFTESSSVADPCHFGMDPDPRIHASDKWIRILLFSSLTFKMTTTAFYFLKVNLHHFSKRKNNKKESQNSRNQGSSFFFCIMIKESGSIPLNNGSGSRRPKNIRIRKTGIQDRGCLVDKDSDPVSIGD